jgi:spore germination protein KC
VTIKQFLGWLRSETEEPFAPRVTIAKRPKAQDVVVEGTALFRDDRMVGWLSDAETRGMLWLRGDVKTGVATAAIPAGGRVSFMMIRSRTKLKPDFSSGRLRMKAMIEVEDDVYESTALIDLGKVEVIHAIEELLRKDIEERIKRSLATLQQRYDTDVLGFGDAVRRAAPRKWERDLKKRWAEEFRQIPVDLSITTRVRRTGEHSAPLSTEKKRIKSTSKDVLKPKE